MRRFGLIVAVLTAATMAFTMTSSPAGAVPYGGSGIVVSDASPSAGGSVTVTGSGFAPNSDVDLFILSTPVLLGTFKADASGVVTAVVALPNGLTGDHTLRLVGVAPSQDALSLEKAIKIGPTGAGALPTTGSDTWGTARTALIVLITGGALGTLAMVRRRTSRARG